MIDELSEGISIVTERTRQQLEFMAFVRKFNDVKENLHELVWSSTSINMMYPFFIKNMPDEVNESFIDFLRNLSFCDIVRQLKSSGNLTPFRYKDDIDALNSAKEKFKNENKTFEQLFLSELVGYLDVFEDTLNDYMQYLFYLDHGFYPTDEDKSGVKSDTFKIMIYNLCKYKKLSNELPSFTIFPELNAAVRWNTERKYKDGNDTIDFLHASAALPYFDYFFTEKELKAIIHQRELDKKYSCVVECNPTKALTLLRLLM